MFQSYLSPISYAFMSFPVAALLFTLPFLVVQYRRYGYINKIRALVLYLLLLYLLNAFYLIMLPMPSSRHNAMPTGNMIQHIPLQFIQDIVRNSNVSADEPLSYLRILRQPDFLQAVFNVFLTVPFGMFLGYYFRTRWVVCILLSFTLSLLFEITQITGIYGFFDHPYRIFDVDDLLTNTLGGITGYRIALWISALLPRIEQLDTRVDLSAKRVTYTRRGIAAGLDAPIWIMLFLLLHSFQAPGAYWITTGVYFVVLPFCTGGRTFGKWVVRIRISSEDGHNRLWGLILRYLLLYGIIIGVNVYLLTPSWLSSISGPWMGIMYGGVMIMNFIFFIHLVIRIFKRNPVLVYEQLSRTCNRITWPDQQHADTGKTCEIP
ncbi:teicoplanin resistance protein VanZ [Paenibacillus helianthi]|uniref:Teicoplanin resistance protein VanZ n=1 Tax=Paenibacillus helianthi TaxID=1349432 RepID=A0ABX3EUB5_9BACL|nr:VanZ family protein [Paenibacillus helianthi]OKP91820.1 teicoplanin resistance protein VanZ [Paenibacillus helianthi]